MKCLIHGLVNEMSQLGLEHTRLVRTIIGLFILYLSLIFFFIAHSATAHYASVLLSSDC